MRFDMSIAYDKKITHDKNCNDWSISRVLARSTAAILIYWPISKKFDVRIAYDKECNAHIKFNQNRSINKYTCHTNSEQIPE